jgi:hypothetical protein
MGNTRASRFAETLVQLVLRTHQTTVEVIQTDQDWRALGLAAARMLFWCGGTIFACRCDGSEIRFAVQVAHAPLGAMAHHISGTYAIYLRRSRGLVGSIFKHYSAIPLHDEYFLDDWVLWMHRPEPRRRIWTAEDAYLSPRSLPWISTDRVVGALWPATYQRSRRDEISPQLIAAFTRRRHRAVPADPPADSAVGPGAAHRGARASRPNIDAIVRMVASLCKISLDDMLGNTRKRAVSKARVIATVLATRNGATAASAARLFNRSRSTLIEQVEYYRTTQPEIFAQAESRLEAFLAAGRE